MADAAMGSGQSTIGQGVEMPTQWVNDRNRERANDDERGFAEARSKMAESRAENQAEAEAFGERETEESAEERTDQESHGKRPEQARSEGRRA